MGTPRAQLTTQKRPGAIRAPCLYYAWFGVHEGVPFPIGSEGDSGISVTRARLPRL